MPETHAPTVDRFIDVAEGMKTVEAVPLERRGSKRLPYRGYVALLLISPTGDRGRPVVLRARNISLTGIGVVSRNMIYPGSSGAMQMLRSDGRVALVGVSVKTSRYMGNMEHHTGMAFVPLPPGVEASEFVDKNGRMVLMDPLLRENLDADLRIAP